MSQDTDKAMRQVGVVLEIEYLPGLAFGGAYQHLADMRYVIGTPSWCCIECPSTRALLYLVEDWTRALREVWGRVLNAARVITLTAL